MADTTLNKRVADLAKKLGVSPESIFTELRDFHKTIATKVAPEIGGLPLDNDKYDAFTPAFEVAEKKGPEWSRLYRSYYDKEEGEGAYDTVINDYLQNYPYDLSEDGMLGYSQKPDGSFANKNQEAETILEDFEKETGEPANPDRPKPKKSLDQPEGGAAQAPGGMPMTPEGQAQAAMQAKANSMPDMLDRLGGSGSKMGNLAKGRVQAQANFMADDIIKQQKKQSDQNNFLRDRYDATGGRGVGAFDSLSPDAKAQAIKNYSTNSFFDSSTQAGKDQEALFYKNNPNYTPPKADIQSQYEAASMNPPSVASADGTATTEEFGSMSPAQQRAFIQNYKYNPQGQSPETVEEGTMMGAQASSNPEVNLETLTVPQGQREVAEYQTLPGTLDLDGMLQLKKDREGHLNRFQGAVNNYTGNDPRILEANKRGLSELQSRADSATSLLPARSSSIPDYSDKIVDPSKPPTPGEDPASNQTVPGQYMPPERVYPAPDSALEGGRGGIDVNESFKQNPALQTDGSGNILPPPDGPGDDITTYSPPDVSNLPPIEDILSKLPEAPGRPQTPYSPPDVSNLPPIEDVFSKLPEAPGRPQQEPAPAPASRAPTPPPTQPKAQGQSPVYGKKDDGTYGVVGYRDNREMKKGMGGTRIKEWTASMDRDRREDDFMNRARQGQVSNPLNSEYNRALGQQNEDAFAKRRAQQAEFARKSAREKELAAMPTPRANAAMDIMNGLPQADQVGIVNQYRKRRGEKPIFNPYSA